MSGHYTKAEIEKSDFLFVSYKHDDDEIVKKVVSALYEKGVRLWYDADLHVGDTWTEVAEALIKHPNCRGVIFFNSIASFKSQPVHFERGWALEKLDSEQHNGRQFYIFPFNISCSSHLYLLKKVFDSLPDDPAIIAREFPFEYLSNITRLFSDKTIFATSNDLEPCQEKLFEAIKDKLPAAIDTDYLRMKKLTQSNTQTQATIRLGICRHKRDNGTVPPYSLQTNQVLTINNAKYIVLDKQGYSTKPVTWLPLYCENDVFVLLSQEIVDVRSGGDALTAWLSGEFKKLCFSAEECSAVRQVRLLSTEDMEKAINKEVFVFPGTETHWWISNMNTGALQKVIRKDGSIYNTGFNFRTTKSGVRPVISIHKDDLAKLTDGHL